MNVGEVQGDNCRPVSTDGAVDLSPLMQAVTSRRNDIPSFLRQIFDTTEPQFDIREALNEDLVVVFDIGGRRPKT